MGGKCPHRKVKKRRLSHKTDRCAEFLIKGDGMVYAQLNNPEGERIIPLPVDEDLPGMGQYYCLHCDRYFPNVAVRDEHFKTKKHKKQYATFLLLLLLELFRLFLLNCFEVCCFNHEQACFAMEGTYLTFNKDIVE